MGVIKKLALVTSFAVVAMQSLTPSQAAPGEVSLTSFTLNKREVGKGETVIATYQLAQSAKSVHITATSVDGGPLAFDLPQKVMEDARHTSGTITFRVPADAGTLSPLLIQLNIDGQLRGLSVLKITCDTAWFFAPRVDTCPFEPIVTSPAAAQP